MKSILLVDDDVEFTQVASHIIEFLGHDVSVAGSLKEAKQWLEFNSFDHILLDFMLPDGSGLHLIDYLADRKQVTKTTFITGHPSIKDVIADLCGPNVDYLLKPLQREDLEKLLNGKSQNKTSSANSNSVMHFGCLLGESEPMQQLYKMIERVSQTDANVMLMGESGVGKEVVAKAIHQASQVSGKLITTNCGGFSKELISSELFGHEKGAFTGAVSRKEGVFERAMQGTLFLDEVTEMPIDMQPNLLRVLETRKVIRVGGTKEFPVDCRVISATNRSIEEIAQQGILREDIYFRLAVFPISIPSLRQRKDDIPLLADAFLAEFNQVGDRNYQFTKAQYKQLSEHDWPGNVRELRHTIHRAFIMSDPDSNELELPKSFASPFSTHNHKSPMLSAGQTIEELERELIYVTLEKVNNNKTLAAEMLGISIKTLYNRLHAYGEPLN